MSRFFRWSMRHGAAILFGIALVQIIVALLAPIYAFYAMTSEMAGNHNYFPSELGFTYQLQIYLQASAASLANAMIPLAGAVIVDRFDRWLAVKERGQAE
jgi:hypothetical protein